MKDGNSLVSGTRVRAFVYDFAAFRFQSQIELPMLASHAAAECVDAPEGDRIPVLIHRGPVSEQLPEAASGTTFVRAAAESSLLAIPGVARFLVAGGRDVLVDVAPEAPLADVRSYLLGWVFGVLCHQNGLLPLHASAIAAGGDVTAFLGESGAGKSTLAAFLQRRGFALIADDICLLQPNAAGLRVIAVAGWLKLWRASLDTLGETPDPATRTFLSQDKYRLLLAERPTANLRVVNLIFPERSQTDLAPSLKPLSTAQTIARMVDTVYLGYLAQSYGDGPRLFRQCAEVLAGARGYALTVPHGFDQMPGVLDLLQAELLGGVADTAGVSTAELPASGLSTFRQPA